MKKNIFVFFLYLLCIASLSAQNIGIIPTPQNVTFYTGNFTWDDDLLFYFDTELKDSKIILEEYENLRGKKPTIINNLKKSEKEKSLQFYLVSQLPIPQNMEQGYVIEITDNKIVLKATTETGLFYAWQSLKQIYRFNLREYYGKSVPIQIPCLSVTDYPMLSYRGWMDDISRGPIPTLDFLKKQVTTLAEFKLNFFTLYTENTFKTATYPELSPQDALTAAEIKELEQFAAQYHIQLIGNQQCFAHMEKILRNPFFDGLADTKYNLNPGNSETYTFLNNILEEEAACYSSPFFNINCDETESLGTGKAAEYIQKVGVAQAYYNHIDSLHRILSSYDKRMMMWGDIALKHKEIINNLSKDIIMLVWSYVPADHFTEMIQPFKEAGFDFIVASGVSMWSTVFPSVDSYIKNIANFARDGYSAGAMGLLNTAWDDSGESLFNSAWHALAWGAEMSWRPILNENEAAAQQERNERLEIFNLNFNFQFFHYYNPDVLITDYLSLLSQYDKAPYQQLYQFGSLWNTDPTCFFPSEVSPEAESNNNDATFMTIKTLEQLKIILEDESNYENSDIIYNALYATSRIYVNLLINKLRFNLYEYYRSPSADNKQYIQISIDDLLLVINHLKNDYLRLWEKENRPYWRDVNMDKYDQLARTLQNIKQQIFITTSLSDNQRVKVQLRTLFNDIPIYYTIDGSEPNKNSSIYSQPFEISQSCIIKTKTINELGKEVTNEKFILAHKGIGALKKLNTEYSSYRTTYSGGGEMALLDGLIGSNDYRDGKWQGYQGVPADIEIDFHKITDIQTITVQYLQNYYDWILAPEDIEILTSKDGKNYQSVRKEHFEVEQVSGTKIGAHCIKNLNEKVQYVRIIVKNPGLLPKEHSGAGSDSFIFLDEIIIQ